MSLGEPGQDEIENPPISIVSPQEMNIDPSSMRFDPVGYFGMLNEAMTRQPESIPAQPNPFEEDGGRSIHPDSHALMAAVDNGYADKKLLNPIEEIRDGIKLGDEDRVVKAHSKLAGMLSKTDTLKPMEKLYDLYFNGGRVTDAQIRGNKIAADIVLKELMQPGSGQAPRAEEASRLGLIDQNELLPHQTVTSNTEKTIPNAGFQFSPKGDVSMTPATSQSTETTIDPNAKLTRLQQDVAESRQRGLQSGIAYKTALAESRMGLNREKEKSEAYKREVEGPARLAGLQHLDDLRTMQTKLAKARVDWYEQLPRLRKDLAASAGNSPLELRAVQNVYDAIKSKKPITKEDWLIASKWLTKGSAQFSTDFMGRAFNRFTGNKDKGGGHPGWLGVPEPPDMNLTEGEKGEAMAADDDMMHQVGEFFRSLLQGITGGKDTPNELPTPKTPAEAQALKPGTRYRRPDGKEMVR